MTQKINQRYAAILILSVLMYSIPFQYGGFILRGIFGVAIILLLIHISRMIWTTQKNPIRTNHLLWVINSIVFFHLALIFVYLMWENTVAFILGTLLGFIFYYVVTNHLRTTF